MYRAIREDLNVKYDIVILISYYMEYYSKTLDSDDASLFELVWAEWMRILCRKPKKHRAKHVRRYIVRY